jgi:aspartokinase-like uncharacterized kinase
MAASHPRMCDVVVKVGGGLLADVAALDRALAAVTGLARGRRVLIVPGGGPFAETVRDVDRRIGIPDEAAHWMAVLGMDQYAHLLASRLTHGVVVWNLTDAVTEAERGRLPVLAPSRWLSESDPLPHTWAVTSDSIAAWVAGEAGARDLVLVKPPGATGTLVDPWFHRTVPSTVRVLVVPADDLQVTLSQLLDDTAGAASG